MTTRKIRARHVHAGLKLVEQDTGPRGGNGRRVGRHICEAHVNEATGLVELRVQIGDRNEPRGPYALTDHLRVIA